MKKIILFFIISILSFTTHAQWKISEVNGNDAIEYKFIHPNGIGYISYLDSTIYFSIGYLYSNIYAKPIIDNIQITNEYLSYYTDVTLIFIGNKHVNCGCSPINVISNKSNQFNLTTKRYSQSDIENIAADKNSNNFLVYIQKTDLDTDLLSPNKRIS